LKDAPLVNKTPSLYSRAESYGLIKTRGIMSDDPKPAMTPPADNGGSAQENAVNRLSGEAAPDLSPEEFARLQRRGETIDIDSRGRVRVDRLAEDNPGVSLRKRRAWYSPITL